MTAGTNLRCIILRYTEGDDDIVGGATVTGTVVYADIPLRLEEQPVQQLLLQQGLETEKILN